jgi:hypothetical protein
MIFIKYEIESANKARVVYTHYMPFHEVHGLHKTVEELEQEGFLIEAIPEPETRENTLAILYIDPETKYLWFEYTPYTPQLTPDEKIEKLEKEKAELQNITDQILIDNLNMQMQIDALIMSSL